MAVLNHLPPRHAGPARTDLVVPQEFSVVEAMPPTPPRAGNLEALGIFILARRTSMGLSQTQFAECIGWTPERVSLLERGPYSMPSLPTLERMAATLHTTLGDVVQVSGYDDRVPTWTGAPDLERVGSMALVHTVHRLLAIEAASLRDALTQASSLLAVVMSVDKIDAFVYDPTTETLVAVGWSDTPMGRQQRQIGMNRLPTANRGREVEVFETGVSFISGDTVSDPHMLVGTTQGLGVQSMLAVPLDIGNIRRGVLVAEDSRRDRVSELDMPFFETVARWVGVVAHRAEMAEAPATDAATAARDAVAEERMAQLTHDLANHLTPLFGRIDLIRRRAQQEGRDEYLRDADKAKRALARMRELISDPLDMKQIELGTVALSPTLVDVHEIVRRVVEEFESDDQPIELSTSRQITAELDAGRVSHALENVVRNAVRHGQPCTPIRVQVRQEHRADGGWIVISVHNQGPAIPTDLLPAIFDRFARRVDSPGLGIGLYLARALMTVQGGTLTVESTPEGGTTFFLALPVAVRHRQ
ncbi:MAG TPA: ATP-binding protein [Chloroflexota bacterium]|nr:ATP-binding protein [Chloroflexota bacterium]